MHPFVETALQLSLILVPLIIWAVFAFVRSVDAGKIKLKRCIQLWKNHRQMNPANRQLGSRPGHSLDHERQTQCTSYHREVMGCGEEDEGQHEEQVGSTCDPIKRIHLILLVVGDLGRSPRMLYHADAAIGTNEFGVETKQPNYRFIVHIIGYDDTPLPSNLATLAERGMLQLHPLPRLRLLDRFRKVVRKSIFLYCCIAAVKLIAVSISLAFILVRVLFVIRNAKSLSIDEDHLNELNGRQKGVERIVQMRRREWHNGIVLLQNPPGFPGMFIASVCCRLFSVPLVVDWHNFTHSLILFEHRISPSSGSPNGRLADGATAALHMTQDATFPQPNAGDDHCVDDTKSHDPHCERPCQRRRLCAVDCADNQIYPRMKRFEQSVLRELIRSGAAIVEGFLGRRAAGGFCVSHRMKQTLLNKWGVRTTLLYDCPAAGLGLITLLRRHDISVRYLGVTSLSIPDSYTPSSPRYDAYDVESIKKVDASSVDDTNTDEDQRIFGSSTRDVDFRKPSDRYVYPYAVEDAGDFSNVITLLGHLKEKYSEWYEYQESILRADNRTGHLQRRVTVAMPCCFSSKSSREMLRQLSRENERNNFTQNSTSCVTYSRNKSYVVYKETSSVTELMVEYKPNAEEFCDVKMIDELMRNYYEDSILIDTGKNRTSENRTDKHMSEEYGSASVCNCCRIHIRVRTFRPCVILTSTSWTDDEDLPMFLDVLKMYDDVKKLNTENTDGNRRTEIPQQTEPVEESNQEYVHTHEHQKNQRDGSINKSKYIPDIYVLITGKGEDKLKWIDSARAVEFQHVRIKCVFAPMEDYYGLVSSADLGISMHRSSSGVDLPMKIVDMKGGGLPVLAYRFPAIYELVESEATFGTAAELHSKLISLLVDFPYKFDSSVLKQENQKKHELRIPNFTRNTATNDCKTVEGLDMLIEKNPCNVDSDFYEGGSIRRDILVNSESAYSLLFIRRFMAEEGRRRRAENEENDWNETHESLRANSADTCSSGCKKEMTEHADSVKEYMDSYNAININDDNKSSHHFRRYVSGDDEVDNHSCSIGSNPISSNDVHCGSVRNHYTGSSSIVRNGIGSSNRSVNSSSGNRSFKDEWAEKALPLLLEISK